MSALQRADRELSGFAGRIGGGMERVGRSMQTVGAALAPVSLALAGIGTVGVRTASQFDSIMAEIAARTGATGTEMQRISDFALQMGADTAFSAQQAGDAFLQLLTSGQTAEQAIATLPAVLDAAAASGADLGQTADMLTDIMASMGIDIEYANDVANDLARAAGASSATIESLGQGFANVGPVAANFGMSMRDTAAVLAVLSENGIKGSEAGTALKSMLTNMTRPTEAVRGAWEELGVSFYDAAGNARPLQNVIADLDRALDPLTVERQNELMYDLASSYGIVALSALRGELSIEDMILMMTEAADASTVAEARMDTFAGTVDALTGSVETLNVTAFTPFMNDTLKPLFKRLTTIVNAMTTLARLNPGLTSTVIKLGAAFVGATTALLGIGTALTLMGPALPIVAAGMGLILSPLGLIGAALAGAAWFAYQFAEELGWLERGLDTIRGGLGMLRLGLEPLTKGDPASFYWIHEGLSFVKVGVKQMGADVLTGIGNLVRDVTGIDLSAIGQTIATKLGELRVTAGALKDRVVGAINTALITLDGLSLASVGTALQAELDSLAVSATGIRTSVVGAINTALVTVSGISLASVGNAISGGLESLEITAPLLRGRVIDAINSALLQIDPATGLTSIETTVRNALQTALQGGAGDVTTDLAGRIRTALETDMGALDLSGVQETVSTNTQLAVHLGLMGAAAVIGGPFGMALSLANVVVSAVEADFLGIGTYLRESGILTAVEGAFATLKVQIDGLLAGIFGGDGAAGEGMGGPASMFRSEGGGIGGAIEGFFEGLATIQLPDLSGLETFLRAGLQPIIDAVNSLAENDVLQTGLADLGNGISGFFASFQGMDTSGLDNVGQVLTVVANAIGEFVGGLIEVGGDTLGSFLSAIGTNLPVIGQGIADILSAFSIAAETGDVGAAFRALGDGLNNIGEALGNIVLDTLTGLASAIGDLIGIDVEAGIAAWGPALASMATAVEAAFGKVRDGIELWLAETELSIQYWLADLETRLADAGITVDLASELRIANLEAEAAALRERVYGAVSDAFSNQGAQSWQAILGGDANALTMYIPVELNPEWPAAWDDMIAPALSEAEASLAENPPEIEVGMRPKLPPGFGQRVLEEATAALTMPGEAGATTFALPLPVEPVFDTANLRGQLQAAIDAAVIGEEAEHFKAVAPLVIELAMDVNNLHDQMQSIIHDASALDFHANLTLDMTLLPGAINVDAIRVAIAERLAGMAPLSSGGGGGGAPVTMYGMDVHAHGGIAAYTGPHWLEQGERVLTVGESRFAGRGGGGNTYIINAYGSSPYELADMVARAERGRGGGV